MFAHLYILGFRPEDSQPGNNQCFHPACLTLTPEIIWSFKVFVHSLKISFDTPRHLETSQVLILDGHFRWGCQMFYNFEFSKNSPSENAWCPVTFSRNCITLLLIAIQIQWRWPYFSFQLYNTDLINGGHLTSDYNCTMQIQWRLGARELQVTIWSRSKPVTSRCEGQLHHFWKYFLYTCTCTCSCTSLVHLCSYTCKKTFVKMYFFGNIVKCQNLTLAFLPSFL